VNRIRTSIRVDTEDEVRCGGPVDLGQLGAEIGHALEGLGARCPVIEITASERLERDPGPAKLRRFVPLGDEHQLAEPVLSVAC